MIPTMLVLGLVIGLVPKPWYPVLIVLAGVFWAGLLVATDVVDAGNLAVLIGAFFFSAANAFVGAAVTRVLLTVVRRYVRTP